MSEPENSFKLPVSKPVEPKRLTNKQIAEKVPDNAEERRKLLDSLASRHDQLDINDLKLHDLLATDVAKDEDTEEKPTTKVKEKGGHV